MTTHQEVRMIARPAAEVYEYVVDLHNFASWVPGLSGFTPPEKPIATGDTTRFKVNGLGMSCTYDALDPARHVTYDIAALFGRTHVDIVLEETEPGTTRMTKTHTVTLTGFGRLMGPVISRIGARQLRDEIDLIKQNLES